MFKDILDSRKITCYSLSKKSGVSYTAINELYRGERDIKLCTVDVLIKISSTLHLGLEDFINKCHKRQTLPSNFKKYFWDVEFDKLDIIEDKQYIISRLLTKGGFEGMVFVFKAFSYEEIKFVTMNSRTIDKYVAAFLSNYFKLDKNEMRYYVFSRKEWAR